MKRLLRSLAVACLALTGAGAGASDPVAILAHLPRSDLQVVTASGTHRFQVWIAADDESWRRGLMFVREMAEDHGMLFLRDQPRFISFWMKNTPLSLDIIFVAVDGRVINIAHRTTPLSEDPIGSVAPVTAVLELLGGTAARIGLKPGDRLIHPHFAPQ